MNDANSAAGVAPVPRPQTCKSMVDALATSVEEVFPWDLLDEIDAPLDDEQMLDEWAGLWARVLDATD